MKKIELKVQEGSRWQGRSSQLLCQENISFDNPPWTRVDLWKSRGTGDTFQHMITAKNLLIDVLKKVRIVSLSLHHPFLKVAQLSAKRVSLGLQLPPWGKVRI